MSKDWEKFFEQGNQAFEADNLEAAESFFKAALAAAEESENELDVAVCSERLGELYFEAPDYREAEPCFNAPLKFATGCSSLMTTLS
jgi:tetratricopeptide (TPR) repeat protein